MCGWVDIAAVTMEKTGCGLMKLHGNSRTGFRGSLITSGAIKLILPSIMMNQVIGTMTLLFRRSHFYVLTKVGKIVMKTSILFKIFHNFSCHMPVWLELIQWILLQIYV